MISYTLNNIIINALLYDYGIKNNLINNSS